MTHFGKDLEIANGNSKEWLGVGAQIGRLVNDWAYRNDLAVFVGNEIASDENVALFNPASAEIQVNAGKAFGFGVDPSSIRTLEQRSCQLEYATAVGAIYHEAMHARFSRFSLESAAEVLTEQEYEALHYLEESRIEAFGVKVMPENTVFLRSSAMNIVVEDLEAVSASMTSVRSAAMVAALILARVDAGVLDKSEIGDVAELITSTLGEDVVAQLREVWLEFQAHTQHSDATALYPLAKRWVEIVNKASQEAGEPQTSESGEPSEGEGEGENPFVRALKEAVKESAEIMKIATQGEVFDEMDKVEAQEEAKAKEEQTKTTNAKKAVAGEVFGRGSGPSGGVQTNSRLQESRVPTAEERVAAVKVSQLLEKAKYRERSQTEVRSVIPQGRLRSRAMVQNAAYKSMGLNTQVEAWQRTVRRHTDDPTLKIGVMVDISGSMGSAMQPLATTAWVLSEAGRRVQAQTAMVYYGSDVFATLKPGQHLEQVNVYTAPDGTEEFDKAFQALDGVMSLTNSDGARLLVVVSDGQYRDDQSRALGKRLAECQRSGVAVLWVHFGHCANSRLLKQYGVGVVDALDSSGLGAVAEIIGQTAANALTAIGKRNA